MDDFAHSQLDLEEAKNPFDLKVLVLYGVARFRGLIISLGILGALLGLFAGAAQHNVYSSMTRLHFEPSVRQAVRAEQAYGVDTGEIRISTKTALLEELELLKDPAIYEAVVEKIGAREILRVADPRSGDDSGTSLPTRVMHNLQAGLIGIKGLDDPFPKGPESEAKAAAYDRLKDNVKIGNQRNTQIIDVKYSDSSPAKAKLILDELIIQMKARHSDRFSAHGKLEDLRINKDLAFQEMSKAMNELKRFKEQCGFHDLDNDLAQCNEEILIRERGLSDMHAERGALLGKVKSISKDLGIGGSIEEDIGEDVTDPDGTTRRGGKQINPAYTRLVRQIESERGALRDSENKFPDATRGSLPWRTQNKIRNLIAQLESDLQATDPYGTDGASGILGGDLGDSFAETRSLLFDTRGELEGLIKKIETNEARIGELEERRVAMEECAVEYGQRKTDAEMRKLKLEALNNQERQLSGLAYMDDDSRSELRIFRSARLAKEKEGPQRSKPLMMGLVGGMALGVGLSILRQLLDRKVRYQETIENTLGLRVLCVVPDLSSKNGFSPAKGKGAA